MYRFFFLIYYIKIFINSISTTSSLEVHKTDSSDDEEMEDVVLNASGCAGNGLGNMIEPVSSNESVSMDGIRPDWSAMQMNIGGGGDSSSSEEMPVAIGNEISRDQREF